MKLSDIKELWWIINERGEICANSPYLTALHVKQAIKLNSQFYPYRRGFSDDKYSVVRQVIATGAKTTWLSFKTFLDGYEIHKGVL